MVIVFLSNGFEEIEALTVVDLLRRAGIEVLTCSITDTKEVVGDHSIKVTADCCLTDINFDDAKMVVLPGGMDGASNLSNDETVVSILKDFLRNENKYVGAICASPAVVLGKNNLLEGYDVVCYPDEDLEKMIEGHKSADFDIETVHKSRNLITSKCPNTAMDFALAIIKELKGETIYNEINNDIKGI